MARPRSDEKRDAVVEAAIRIIAAHGLGASTAAIAKEAGVSNGALFTYFETKAALLNHLYLTLKADTAAATTADLPLYTDLRTQMQHVWNGWLRWGAANPERRRALALLSVSHDITPATREAASASYAGVAMLLDRSRAGGALRDAPLMFVAAIVMALVDTTLNYMQDDAANGAQHAALGFEALWRAIS